MIITIDGPAAAGKSTVARAVAERLGIRYLDTGAMYRALAWKALREGVSPGNPDGLVRLLQGTRIDVDGPRVWVDGREVTDEIRSERISQAASRVSVHAGVRTLMVEMQRRIGRRNSIVTEGRDQGSVVFPGADYKFFLTASLEERARRRQRDTGGPIEEIRARMERRDARDRSRAVAPLVRPQGAVEIDTTGLSVEEVVQRVLETVRSGRRPGGSPC